MIQYIMGWSLRIGTIVWVLVTLVSVVLFSKKLTEDRISASDIVAYCDSMLAMLLDPKFQLDQKLDFKKPYEQMEKTNQKGEKTIEKVKNTKEYLESLFYLLKAPDWKWNQDKERWNIWAPCIAVYIWTFVSIALICLR